MSQVFLSHVEKDGGVVEEIAAGLEREGYTSWYYEEQSKKYPGVPHRDLTREAIEEADIFGLLVSSHALDDPGPYVEIEINQAVKRQKRFLPLLLDVTYSEFERRRPDWEEVLVGAVAVDVPPDRASETVPNLVAGLKKLGIQPGRAGEVTEAEEPQRTETDVSPIRILISYRQADANAIAARIHDRLAQHFGGGNVFRDVASIAPGALWTDDAIDKAIASCDVFLLLISPRTSLAAPGPSGTCLHPRRRPRLSPRRSSACPSAPSSLRSPTPT